MFPCPSITNHHRHQHCNYRDRHCHHPNISNQFFIFNIFQLVIDEEISKAISLNLLPLQIYYDIQQVSLFIACDRRDIAIDKGVTIGR